MRRHLKTTITMGLAASVAILSSTVAQNEDRYEMVGSIERLDPRADDWLAEDAKIEKLTDDRFGWSEGPVWMDARQALYFTDVPGNTLYAWSEEDGLETALDPSGPADPDPEIISSAGANGLIADGDDAILMAVHGDRNVVRLDLETLEREVLVDRYDGKAFNSPNDLVRASSGALYFTDPPYGLAGGNESAAKEQAANRVYRLDPDGTVISIDDTLTWPNGVALSPDEQTLYVATSNPRSAKLYAYALDAAGHVQGRQVLIDLGPLLAQGEEGYPDGLDVAQDGTIFLTGPGGVHIVSPEGERLALIRTGTRIANTTLTDDEDMLYMTSAAFLARVPLKGQPEAQ